MILACTTPPDTVVDATDCNDQFASIHPGAVEIWYDGIDENCDGGDDYDQDGDLHISDQYGGDDCDDLDPLTYPGAGAGHDCDSSAIDADQDGYDSSDDCNDNDPSVYPGAAEIPDDGIDQDCDGLDRESDSSPSDTASRDTGVKGGDCGCSSNASGVSGGALLGLLGLGLRRRRVVSLS